MSITILGEGKAPPEVLSALREIDPRADLVHLGGTKWWLGTRAPNPAGVRLLAQAKERHAAAPVIDDPAERAVAAEYLGRELVMYQIMADGFCPVDLYTCEGSPGMDIVDDFRQRDFGWRNKREQDIRAELQAFASLERGNEARSKGWASRAVEAARDAFRYTFRGARSVTVDHTLE